MQKKIVSVVSALILAGFAIVPNAFAGDSCSSRDDCPPGVACNSGICATSEGGRCYSSSECGGGVCNSGKCSNSPDGHCFSSSECPGGVCNSGKCSNVQGGTCYSSSECPGGVCNSGKCEYKK